MTVQYQIIIISTIQFFCLAKLHITLKTKCTREESDNLLIVSLPHSSPPRLRLEIRVQREASTLLVLSWECQGN